MVNLLIRARADGNGAQPARGGKAPAFAAAALIVAFGLSDLRTAGAQQRTAHHEDTNCLPAHGLEASSSRAQGCRSPITIADILKLREITEQRVAPNGRTVAFAMRSARVATNTYVAAICLANVNGDPRVRTIAKAPAITNLRWTPDGRAITYLTTSDADGMELLRISAAGGRPELLLRRRLNVIAFEWAPDGARIALVIQDAPDKKALEVLSAHGVTYDGSLTAADLLDRSWVKLASRVVVLTIRTNQLDTVWTAPSTVIDLAWDPDGRRLAVTHRASTRPADVNNFDIAILSLRQRTVKPLVPWSGVEDDPQWSRDGSSLVFRSQGDIEDRPQWIHLNTLFMVQAGDTPHALGNTSDLSDARPVAWLANRPQGLLVERRGLLLVVDKDGVTMLTDSTDHLSHCTPDSAGTLVTCVRQDLMTPPEIAVVDPATGRVRTLTHLNSLHERLQLGEVSELRWANRYGHQANGFLIKPVGYVPGHRYPFLVILYGFERQFIGQAQWIASFPAQVFAAHGFVVLLMNPPAYGPFRWQGDSVTASFYDSDNPVASIEAAADTLTDMGLADPSRGGIMGWSMGSYWADLVITRTDIFRVASSGETAWRTPGSYWLGNDQSRYVQRAFFGGPPAGPWFEAYGRSSPVLRPPPRVPVLREYELRSLHGLEYLLWVDQGAELELVFYPGDGHVLDQPVHRQSSMQRNLAWFEFWLLGLEDSRQGTQEQYQRWRAMRSRVDARRAAQLRHCAAMGLRNSVNKSVPSAACQKRNASIQ